MKKRKYDIIITRHGNTIRTYVGLILNWNLQTINEYMVDGFKKRDPNYKDYPFYSFSYELTKSGDLINTILYSDYDHAISLNNTYGNIKELENKVNPEYFYNIVCGGYNEMRVKTKNYMEIDFQFFNEYDYIHGNDVEEYKLWRDLKKMMRDVIFYSNLPDKESVKSTIEYIQDRKNPKFGINLSHYISGPNTVFSNTMYLIEDVSLDISNSIYVSESSTNPGGEVWEKTKLKTTFLDVNQAINDQEKFIEY